MGAEHNSRQEANRSRGSVVADCIARRPTAPDGWLPVSSGGEGKMRRSIPYPDVKRAPCQLAFLAGLFSFSLQCSPCSFCRVPANFLPGVRDVPALRTGWPVCEKGDLILSATLALLCYPRWFYIGWRRNGIGVRFTMGWEPPPPCGVTTGVVQTSKSYCFLLVILPWAD